MRMDVPNQVATSEVGLEAETLVHAGNTKLGAPAGDSDAAFTSKLESSIPGSSCEDGDDGAEASSHGKDEKQVGEASPLMDDRSRVWSKIKKLQDELVKIEAGAREQQMLENVESRWNKELERVGGDAERQNWAKFQEMKAQSFVKDTTAFAFSREWVHEREDSFFWEMMEREEFDKQLTQRRKQWEEKNGVTQPKGEDSPNPRLPQSVVPFRVPLPTFMDPLSDEALFNTTPGAQGYDAQERTLRNQIHEIVRGKHSLFLQWKRAGQNRPPKAPDAKLENIWPRPLISYVQWPFFKFDSPLSAFSSEEKQHLFALDMLDGEPDMNATRASRSFMKSKSPDDGSKVPTAIPELDQGFVPERIRLNGPQFTQTFKLLALEGFGTITYAPHQIVLLQPYRPLVYHEKSIRDRFNELKKKFEISDDDEATPRTGSTEGSEHPDAVQGDAEHEASKDPNESVHTSQKSEMDAEPGHRDNTATQDGGTEGPKQESKDSPDETEFPLAHSKTAMEYLGCLIDFYDATVSIRRKYIQGTECRKIHFRDLWYLFNPGDEVVRRDGRQVYRVIEVVNPTHRASSSRNYFFDFDDKDTSRNFQVSLRQDLIKRGKKFVQAACMKLENTFYSGPTADGEEVESQVVIDFETALSSDRNFDEQSVPPIKSLLADADDGDSTSSVDLDDLMCSGWCCDGDFVCKDNVVDERRKEDYINSLIPETYSKLPSVAVYPRDLGDTTGENALTDGEFLLMTYRVFAFVLRTRKWAKLDLTYMEDAAEDDAERNENDSIPQPAFEQLVLPEGHKTIVLSLISQHYRNRDSGRHSIEHSDIFCGGDLGSTAREVEQALDLNFNLANRWGCILLLDEADVFLASRTETDFERNGLVAVFLRVLEYYAGILFLTTNRVGVIDEAFRSRIHISLYYPPLGFDETQAVFKLNLTLIQYRFNNDKRNIKIDQDEIIDFALEYFKINEKARWNGRQIRNACQTALALAEFKAQGGSHQKVLQPDAEVRLAVDHFKTVSKAYLEFTKYLKQLYGIHEDARAKELGLRARETNRQPQAQPTQQPSFGGNPYNNAPLNPIQTAYTQSYQPASMTGPVQMNPIHVQQPNQQVLYYANPSQIPQSGNFMSPGLPSQVSTSPNPQQNQDFVGMQFQPAQRDTNQQAQSWRGQASPLGTSTLPQTPSPQAQQQYQAQAQQNLGTAHLGSNMPAGPPFQAPQSMPLQQPMQQQQQQSAPTWYQNMGVQNLQSAAGQGQSGPSPQEGTR
ncbi:hypothetical protein N8I77_011424 [Diaporthe amygdali]|uniref:ATPase AAA-type core domain-containing protein n=1 Tax=Phomopsis amygdali TaxID=1214568 RepID=A0AAD9VYM3_PHOAM|nr:hypothetical protein N8I77_011424 [Diaporthe amygdali]